MSKWLMWFAVISLLGFPVAVLAKRLGMLPVTQAMMLAAFTTIMLALIVLVVGMIVTFLQRRTKPESSRLARKAAYLSLIPLLTMGYTLFSNNGLPSINDISTDLQNPPVYAKAQDLRLMGDNSTDYTPVFAEQQQAAYPDIGTIRSKLTSAQAFAKAEMVAEKMKWEITYSNAQEGQLEAVETTFLWAFKDDVVIRIRVEEGESLIDIRSSSRVGLGDMGVNAKRVREFIQLFNAW